MKNIKHCSYSKMECGIITNYFVISSLYATIKTQAVQWLHDFGMSEKFK